MVAALSKGLLSQGTLATFDFIEHSPNKGGKYHWITVTTVMQDTGHPGKHNRNTPGCIYLCFSTRKCTPNTFHAHLCTPP